MNTVQETSCLHRDQNRRLLLWLQDLSICYDEAMADDELDSNIVFETKEFGLENHSCAEVGMGTSDLLNQALSLTSKTMTLLLQASTSLLKSVDSDMMCRDDAMLALRAEFWWKHPALLNEFPSFYDLADALTQLATGKEIRSYRSVAREQVFAAALLWAMPTSTAQDTRGGPIDAKQRPDRAQKWKKEFSVHSFYYYYIIPPMLGLTPMSRSQTMRYASSITMDDCIQMMGMPLSSTSMPVLVLTSFLRVEELEAKV
ncbi:hypothetical protein FMUND_4069 [Fusarium mundagurra]|uniref:Uncharacterized protein n=1 Tax=Fusarium mundagurra TaxID=1567541 RepID=A0A8H5YZY3_9HYPO|nr:hypothetical protein FMUND_4069 [Fusarium mundagurra]